MTFKRLSELHKHTVHNCDACHTAKCNERGHDKSCLVCKEESWIKKYPYYALDSVCEECFSDPNNVCDDSFCDMDGG